MPADLDFKTCLFRDREDAARRLLEILPQALMQKEQWIILCLSSGSVEIAEFIAQHLKIYYDLLFVEPVYAPNNDECQIAMISETQEIVLHQNLIESFEIPLDFVYTKAHEIYHNILIDYQYQYRKSLPISALSSRNVLLLDEGCETGLSTLCALKSVIAMGVKKVSLASPVIAEDLYGELEMKIDTIFTNYKIKDFIEVDYYYETLQKRSRKEVQDMLNASDWFMPFKGAK